MRGRGVFLRTLILSKAKDLWLIFQKGLIEILQPFGLQDEESENSPTPQLYHIAISPRKAYRKQNRRGGFETRPYDPIPP